LNPSGFFVSWFPDLSKTYISDKIRAMKVSIIIPVWHGETVIFDCLQAIHFYSDPAIMEIICVNNASPDNSTEVIAQFPQVRLLEQPVNMGFAGGVNIGLMAAQGDLLVLLNQDCLVHEGWLTAVIATFAQSPQTGIVGGLIFHADGSLDHAGAYISRPRAYGVHETAVTNPSAPYPVDYVTGALFAIRRAAWQTIGPLDDSFYPGYFEESDYCYRARHHGYEIFCAPDIQATHLRSSRTWQQDPLRHQTNQNRSRYRFIAKHFSAAEIIAFAEAEDENIGEGELHIHQIIGRLLALRDTLRDLPTIAASRQQDLGQPPSPAHERLLSVNFTRLLRCTWAKLQERETAMSVTQLQVKLRTSQGILAQLQEQEHQLQQQINNRLQSQQNQPDTLRQRIWRRFILQPLGITALQDDYHSLFRLNAIQLNRLNQLDEMHKLLSSLENEANTRLELLEKLIDYEYR
jgi:GT2 family glycosyltransferase